MLFGIILTKIAGCINLLYKKKINCFSYRQKKKAHKYYNTMVIVIKQQNVLFFFLYTIQ